MANWMCNDCGMAFDEPKKVHECVGYFGSSEAWDTFCYCPCCGSDNYEEAVDCAICGEPDSESYIDGNGVCEGCRHEIEKNFIAWLDSNGGEARASVLATICDICSDLYTKAVNADG